VREGASAIDTERERGRESALENERASKRQWALVVCMHVHERVFAMSTSRDVQVRCSSWSSGAVKRRSVPFRMSGVSVVPTSFIFPAFICACMREGG